MTAPGATSPAAGRRLEELAEAAAADERDAADLLAEPGQLGADEAQDVADRDLCWHPREDGADGLDLLGEPVEQRSLVAAGDVEPLESWAEQAAGAADLQGAHVLPGPNPGAQM